MKLIGIRIDQENTNDSVKKNLKEEWYPFWEDYNLSNSELQDVSSEDLLKVLNEKSKKRTLSEEMLYTRKEKGPKISLHAIVGKNGSGKSTILEILFRIINNFSYKVIGNENRENSAHLLYSRGLSASLYYSIEEEGGEIFFCVNCESVGKEDECIIELLKFGGGSGSVKTILPDAGNSVLKQHRHMLEHFFYSIIVNYSHYSLNVREIEGLETANNKQITDDNNRALFYENGIKAEKIYYEHWLNGLFHKNDGYLTPAVINPMRIEGNFDVNRERHLSHQRLLGLLILKPDFLNEYNVNRISVFFSMKNIKDKLEKQQEIWNSYSDSSNSDLIYNKAYLEVLLSIYDKWYSKLNVLICNLSTVKTTTVGDLIDNISILPVRECQLHSTLLYIASKTISITFKYSDYDFHLINEIDALINLLQSKSSHITFKIQQASYHIANRLLDTKYTPVAYCNWEEKMLSEEFKSVFNKGGISIDDVFPILYPPIYETDIILEKKEGSKDDIYLKNMSSGERQMLYSLSGVLYHLVNLSTVQTDEYRVSYKNINIILDEVEMYYHPEYQRQFIDKILTLIEALQLNKEKINSINICVITHSPFLLSDILKNNILFLNEGTVANKKVNGETFGANIYDILNQSFFLDTSVGDFALDKIQSIVDSIENKSLLTEKEYKDLSETTKIIGEPLLRTKIQSMLDDRFFIKNNLVYLNNEIKELKDRLKHLEDTKDRFE